MCTVSTLLIGCNLFLHILVLFFGCILYMVDIVHCGPLYIGRQYFSVLCALPIDCSFFRDVLFLFSGHILHRISLCIGGQCHFVQFLGFFCRLVFPAIS